MKRQEGRKVFRELDHTADLCVEIYGRDHLELVGNAVETLYTLLGFPLPPRDIDKLPRKSVKIIGFDLEDALVRLLGELLYGAGEELERVFPEDILLENRGPGAGKTVITLEGGRWNCPEQIMEEGREIKAVTYHEVSIRKAKDGYLARIVMDV